MNEPEDRILDLALEELYGSRLEDKEAARIEAALRRVDHKVAEFRASGRASSGPGRRVAAVAASLLSLAFASWFVLGRFDRPQAPSSNPDSSIARQQPWEKRIPDGKIQAVQAVADPGSGQRVTLDLGSAHGVLPDSRFDVLRGSEVIGGVIVQQVERTWAMGAYRSKKPGGTPTRAGDAVRALVVTAGEARVSQDEPSDRDVKTWIEQLSDPDAALRDRAFTELKWKGPQLLARLREELTRARDAEVRARLQELITYWTHAVAARVGQEIITWDEVNATFGELRPSDVTEELRRQALRAVVEERVFLQEARRRSIVVAEEELREGVRRKDEAYGGAEAHRAALRARGMTPESEREELRRQLAFQKLQERILQEARENPSADPFKLDLKETPREELRRWYDANSDKFAAVDRVDLCWVELSFEGEQERLAKKALGDALVEKARAKTNLGRASAEMGVKESIQIGVLERGVRLPGPFSEEAQKLILDSFKFGEVRVIEDNKSSILVVQLYDRTRRVSETFEQAEAVIRAMFENQRLEGNRRRMRQGLLKQASITPNDLFEDR